jgi:hypothetical protein
MASSRSCAPRFIFANRHVYTWTRRVAHLPRTDQCSACTLPRQANRIAGTDHIQIQVVGTNPRASGRSRPRLLVERPRSFGSSSGSRPFQHRSRAVILSRFWPTTCCCGRWNTSFHVEAVMPRSINRTGHRAPSPSTQSSTTSSRGKLRYLSPARPKRMYSRHYSAMRLHPDNRSFGSGRTPQSADFEVGLRGLKWPPIGDPREAALVELCSRGWHPHCISVTVPKRALTDADRPVRRLTKLSSVASAAASIN